MQSDGTQKNINSRLAVGHFTQTVNIGLRHQNGASSPIGLFLHINFALQSLGISKDITLDITRQTSNRVSRAVDSAPAAESAKENGS